MQLTTKLKRRSLIAAGIGALATASIGTALWFNRSGPPGTLTAKAFSGDLPLTDPQHKAWRGAKQLAVPLIPQQMYYPRLAKATMEEIKVRALYNGKQLGFLLEWGDKTANDLESIVAFRDAAAVMLPLNPTGERPAIFMGGPGNPVYIMHWKASWQKDVDHGFQDVEKSYPRWFNDVYPGHPEYERLGMSVEAAKIFYPGLAVGNILSQQKRISPVEEAVAEGFGTLTSLDTQRAAGRGIMENGKWLVSLGTPVAETDVPDLKPGSTIPIAFATWDGEHGQVGGRKHFADWIEVTLPGGEK